MYMYKVTRAFVYGNLFVNSRDRARAYANEPLDCLRKKPEHDDFYMKKSNCKQTLYTCTENTLTNITSDHISGRSPLFQVHFII